MKDERLNYYQICTKLAINPDDEFVNSHYKVCWSLGKKPYNVHTSTSDFEYQADKMLFGTPEKIECDHIRRVHVPAHFEYIIDGNTEEPLDFETAVLIHTDEAIENIVFHYKDDDYVSHKKLRDYLNMFFDRNYPKKEDYIDNITIKLSNDNVFKMFNVMMILGNSDYTEAEFRAEWFESILN